MSKDNQTGMPLDGVLDKASAEERQVRTDLAAAFRLVAHYGWDDMIFTHLTARVPGTEHFLINPYNLCFNEICASNLVKIDGDGEKVMDSPHTVNRAGFVIHSAVHGSAGDAHAVMHLHTQAGQAVSAQEDGLLPITQVAMFVTEDMATHEYEGVAYDTSERERLVKDLGDKHCLLLRNHGTLTVGEEIADAFLLMYFFERACEAQVAAQSGGKLHQPSADSIARSAGAIADGIVPIGRSLAWPAMLRKADRIDPSFRL